MEASILAPNIMHSFHTEHSTLREHIIEHIFIAEVMKYLWNQQRADIEILKPEFDTAGYDIMMAHNNVIRHIQLKAVTQTGKAASVKVNVTLAEKPSGCVIWLVVTPNLDIVSYRWFGNTPGHPLPNIDTLKVAKHTKGNALGEKRERPNQKVLPKSHFTTFKTLPDILTKLFG